MSVWTTIAAAVIVAATGLGWTFALFEPGQASIPTRLALVVPFGFATIALIAFVLALTNVLYLPVFLGVYSVATAATWMIGHRRAGLSRHLS